MIYVYGIIYPSPRLPLGTECLHQDFSQGSKGIPAKKTAWLQSIFHCLLPMLVLTSLNVFLHMTMVFNCINCFVRCANICCNDDIINYKLIIRFEKVWNVIGLLDIFLLVDYQTSNIPSDILMLKVTLLFSDWNSGLVHWLCDKYMLTGVQLLLIGVSLHSITDLSLIWARQKFTW